MSPRLRDVVIQRREPQLFLARVKTSPTDVNEGVMVLVDAFDQRLEWGPCPWTPRDGAFPARDDRALVARVAGETWVVGWWPR